MVPAALLTSMTCHCCVNNTKQRRLAKKMKFSLQFCITNAANKFIKKFRNQNWSLSSVKKLVTNHHKPDSGKKCRAWIAQNVDSVEDLVLGQERLHTGHSQNDSSDCTKDWNFQNISAWDRETRLKTAVLEEEESKKT